MIWILSGRSASIKSLSVPAYAVLITYAVLAKTPIGVVVFALKLGVSPVLLGVHAA